MHEKFYTKGEYIEKNPTWHLEYSPWKAKQITRIIEKNNLQPLSIAEVGCGAGEVLNQLYIRLPKNVKFTGYEISPKAFELCQSRNKDRLEFKLSDLTQEEHKLFDMILCIDVFEPIE